MLDVAAKAPPLSACKPIDQGGNSVLYAGDGSRLGYIASDEARTPVAVKRVPSDLKHATVAIEDERFYEHDGIDYNSDGWQDLFAVNSYASADTQQWEAHGGLPRTALFENVGGHVQERRVPSRTPI